MEFKQLLKNTSYLAGTRIVQFFAGLIRAKISAVLLGTTGIGIVNQMSFFTQKISQFTLLSMSEAVVKQISENSRNENVSAIINSVLKSYIILILSFMTISLLALNYFSEFLTVYIFGNILYLSYFYIALFSIPILIIDSIPFSILKAFKGIESIAKARIIALALNLVLAVTLIINFKLEGAIAFIPLSFLIDLFFNFYFARKVYLIKYNITLRTIWNAPIISSFVKELFLFSGFGLTVGLYSIVSELVCRSIVISNLGIESIGLYSPIIMWGSLFVGFILPSFSTYLYPRFCEIKSNKEISGLLNDALRLGSFALLPLLFLGIPFREFFINLFYSNEFIQASIYLPYHFIGIVFYVWWYIFAQALTPTGRIKQHGIFQVIFFSLDIGITFFFVNSFGIFGWMLKHIVSPFIFFWIYGYYLNLSMNFSITKLNSLIMSYLILSSIGLILIDISYSNGSIVNYFLGPCMLVASYFLLQSNEKQLIVRRIYKIFKSE